LQNTNNSDTNDCMIGSIHTDIKCQTCNSILKDDRRTGLRCKNHPDSAFTGKCRVHFKGVRKRFKTYQKACKFLNHLRYEVDENLFDLRKYKSNAHLGFIKLAEEFIDIKRHEIKKSSLNPIKACFNHAFRYFGNINIRSIKPKDLQLFLNSLTTLSSKTKHDFNCTMKQFFKYLLINEYIEKPLEFPKVKYQLQFRNTVSHETQQTIINEIKRISYKDSKIWLGIYLMHRYFNTRPSEIRLIKECNIDLTQGKILLTDTKDRQKYIFLIPKDIILLKQFNISTDDVYFFRKKNGEVYGNQKFGRWCQKACENLGILYSQKDGVTLYSITRHSSVVNKRANYSPEQIKLASGHCTSASFNRYFITDPEYLRMIYADSEEVEKGNKKGIQLKVNNSCIP